MRRTLTVVSAGLRSPSSTRMLADLLAEAATTTLARTGEEVEVRHVEVREHAHAIVDALLTGFPSGDLARALDDVTTADALVVVIPTFQASYSGLFKSFMDLIEEGTLRGMPVILAATGGTERHSLVVDHALRPLFAYLRATLPLAYVFAEAGRIQLALTSSALRARGVYIDSPTLPRTSATTGCASCPPGPRRSSLDSSPLNHSFSTSSASWRRPSRVRRRREAVLRASTRAMTRRAPSGPMCTTCARSRTSGSLSC